MDYAGGTDLWKYQWDLIHNPESILFAWTQDEEEGAYTWDFFGEKYARLFNHIYDKNNEDNLAYLEKIKSVGTADALKLDYTESESKKWTKDEKSYIDSWEIGTYDGDKIAISVFDKIKQAIKDGEIEDINLTANRIYIGNFTIGDKKYPVATYAPKGTVKGLKKITVTDSDVLQRTDTIKHIYCDETYTKYLIIAFYKDEAEKTDPSLIMQIEKFFGDDTKDKWLEYLGVLEGEEEGEVNPAVGCESGYCCTVCGADLTITKEKLDLIFPTGNNITTTLAEYFNTALKTAGFNTCKSQAHFFAQSYVETKGYTELAENPNYRYEGVLALHNQKNDAKLFFNQDFFDNNSHLDYFHFKVYKNLDDSAGNYTGQNYDTFKWRSSETDTVRVPTGGDAAYKLTKGKGTFEKVNFSKSEKISRNRQLFSIIYANKYENGSPSTEDGYNYRGQGAIHLTWRENYRHAQTHAKELFNEDFDWVNHPEYLVNNEKDAVYSAVAYFYFRLKKDINKLNEWDIDKVSYNVNGGYNGLPQRQAQYTRLSTQVFKLSECKTKNTDE